MLINRLDVHLKRIRSGDFVDDQLLNRSCVIFPGSQGCRFPESRADKSRDVQVAKGSRDESRVGSYGPIVLLEISTDTKVLLDNLVNSF